MGSLYERHGFFKKQVGEYMGGDIYYGYGLGRTLIGCYDDFTIYDVHNKPIGCYENGMIYSGNYVWNNSPIGEYNNGIVYDGHGWDKTSVGEYYGDDAGGAAFLLFFNNVSNTDNSYSLASAILGSIFFVISIIIFIYVTSLVPFLRSIINKCYVYFAIFLNLGSLWWLNNTVIKIRSENFVCVLFYEIMLNIYMILYDLFVNDLNFNIVIDDNFMGIFLLPSLYVIFSSASAYIMTKLHNNSYTLYTISGVSSIVIGELITFKMYLNDLCNIEVQYFVYMFVILVAVTFIYFILALIIFFISKTIIPLNAINKIKIFR